MRLMSLLTAGRYFFSEIHTLIALYLPDFFWNKRHKP